LLFFIFYFMINGLKEAIPLNDQKLISPLLDAFQMGAPISEHHGVACYPAIKENSNKKYILKVISVPASQAQFDAMLLAGAYKDPSDAMEYFREKGENILKEAELLKTLSKIEGFLPYDGWQMEPIARRRLGYEVYLIGSYKRSLDKHIRSNAFTHLEAINLGLDLCSALSVCRQSGFLFVDLKPANIYVSGKKEYRIGDLGFLSLDTLRYASLPERYFSPYSPPELQDPMVSVNLTADTYAVGMILYQLYNDGSLPFTGMVPTEELPAPCHADYELAEIIMKAVHPDPEQRWNDPRDLGKAIASYMDRNSVRDIPITPFIPLDVDPEDIVAVSSNRDSHPDEPVPDDFSTAEEPDPEIKPFGNEEPPSEEIASVTEEQEAAEEEPFAPEEQDVPALSEPEVLSPEESVPLSCEASVADEESESSRETESVKDPEVSEEVAKILSKADDIISHEIPAESVFPVEEAQPDPFDFVKDDTEVTEENFPEEPLMEETSEEQKPVKKKKARSFENTSHKKKVRKFLSRCVAFLLICALAAGGFWYYQNIFLQTVDALTVSGTQDEITVLIDTGVEESQLTVYCTDGNGKQKTASVVGGKAVFSDLKPSTEYTIRLDMSGFHKLTGQASQVFTTDATTQVLSFQAIAGSEDGSVKLDFTVDGGEPDFWNIRYTAEGEEERMETVTGHSASISGLTIGKLYTFTLDGGKNFDLGGETTLQYMASRLILAEDLRVTSDNGNEITVHWNIPGDVVVDNWRVRFYDGYGFEELQTVTENKIQLAIPDPAADYTVEITAAGMTQPSRIRISADPIHVSGFTFDDKSDTELKISWEFTGNSPEGGWLLIYTADGSGSQVVTCEKPTAVIKPVIPGALYDITLQSADTRTVFNNKGQCRAREAKAFTANGFVPENVTVDLLKTPMDSKWTCETITEADLTNTFTVGDSASVILRSSTAVYQTSTKTKVLFVYRDAYGNALPELSSETSLIWKSIWDAGDPKNGEIDIPHIPSSPGNYVLELYFDGSVVAKLDLTVAG